MKENYVRLLSAAAILGAFSITCANAQGPGIGPMPTPTPAPVPVIHAIPAHAIPAHAIPAHAIPAHAIPATNLKPLALPSMNTSKPAIRQTRSGHVQHNIVVGSQARATNITRAVAPKMVVPAPSGAHVEPMGMGVSSVMNAPVPVQYVNQSEAFH